MARANVFEGHARAHGPDTPNARGVPATWTELARRLPAPVARVLASVARSPRSDRLLRESSKGRLRELVPVRYGRMLQSPLSLFSGAALNMAADLATTPATGLRVQACGDCHLANFGAFATPERRVIVDGNDETLPAPWEWDVKQLGASFVLACRENGHGRHDARANEPTALSGYLGRSDRFDEAIADFAIAYADQSERDHAALVRAVRLGKLEVVLDA